jgi:hypothetical protein
VVPVHRKDGGSMRMIMGAAVGQGLARRNVESSRFPEAAKSAVTSLGPECGINGWKMMETSDVAGKPHVYKKPRTSMR